jgi:hypothetical protein
MNITVTGASLKIDFGAGCTIGPDFTASGSFTGTVAGGTGSPTTVTLAFANLVVNSYSIDGSIAFARANGSFGVTLTALKTHGVTHSGSLTLSGAGTSLTLDGSLSRTDEGGSSSSTIAFDKVSAQLGACYPNSGTASVAIPAGSGSITFEPSTPVNGIVELSVNGSPPVPAPLPSYGRCPSGE